MRGYIKDIYRFPSLRLLWNIIDTQKYSLYKRIYTFNPNIEFLNYKHYLGQPLLHFIV